MMNGTSLESFARKLDWNLLRTFVVVAQERSLTGAANRLFIQQPAISMAMKRLEESMGCKLIDRSPKQFELTNTGQQLYDRASQIFGIVTRLPTAPEEDSKNLSGHIEIQSISHIVNEQWDNILEEFFSEHPKITIRISVATTSAVFNAVERGESTIGITDGVPSDHFERRHLMSEQHGLFCGRNHPLFGKKKVSRRQLRGLPFVNFPADLFGGEHMGPVTAVRASISFGHFARGGSAHVHEVKRMIAANIGIGILPLALVKQDEQNGKLWRLPHYDSKVYTDVYLISNPAIPYNRVETLFLDKINKIWPIIE